MGEVWIVFVFFGILFTFIFLASKDSGESKEAKVAKDLSIDKKFGSKTAFNEFVSAYWELFLTESQQTTPSASKHPKAALFRHAWKRATVLEQIYKNSNNLEKQLLYHELKEKSAREYDSVAPTGPYGKIRLKCSNSQFCDLLKIENKRLTPTKKKTQETKILACIYIGIDKDNRVYIGQTVNEPEFRWTQHRKDKTGPFKDGQPYIRWEVVKGSVCVTKLDYWESYYIGLFNAYKCGYNGNRGNNSEAYDKGCLDRLRNMS